MSSADINRYRNKYVGDDDDEHAEMRSSVSPGKRSSSYYDYVALSAPVAQAKLASVAPAKPVADHSMHSMAAAFRTDYGAGSLPSSSGAGRPLPKPVQRKMENAFSANFSAVRVHENSAVQQTGALAYAQGTDLYFASGQFAPESQSGQELLGHELAHVVQQSEGRVSVGAQGKGLPFTQDESLEREADQLGAAAARGEIVRGDGIARSPVSAPAGVAQGYLGEGYVDAFVEGAENVVDNIANWGAEQITDAGKLLEYAGMVSDVLAKRMIVQIASNTALLVAFVNSNPHHRLAEYIISQLPIAEIVTLAVGASLQLRAMIINAVRTLNQVPQFFNQLYRASAEAARQMALEIETELLPAILSECAELAHDLFHEWWPTNTGLEGQLTLTAGAQVPVWPAPPIFVGGQGQAQGEVKLYNKSHDHAPQIEFEVGVQRQETVMVGLTMPEVAEVDAREVETSTVKIKTTTNFSDIDWNTGLITALRGGQHQSAFDAMCTSLGNVVGATQFEFTYAASSAEGMGASAGLGDLAKASVTALQGMGYQLTVQTPTTEEDGKIEAQGNFTVSLAGQIGVAIPGVPTELAPVVGYLLANASVGGGAQAEIGGRINFKLPKAPITDMIAPEFAWVELYIGAQINQRIVREQGTVATGGAIRFTREPLENFDISGANQSDGVTPQELRFAHLSLKGSVALDSELTGHALRSLVAGDNEAIEFLTGHPSVGGKVEVEFKFTRSNIIALLVALGFVNRDENDTDPLPESAQSALDALDVTGGLDVVGFLQSVGAVVEDFGSFMWQSLDKVKVEVHADGNHREGGGIGGPGGSVSGSGSLRLRAAYSADYNRAEIEHGLTAGRVFLQRALPAGIAGYFNN